MTSDSSKDKADVGADQLIEVARQTVVALEDIAARLESFFNDAPQDGQR